MQIRQGDVLLVSIDNIPQATPQPKQATTVLAFGVAMQNSHSITSTDVTVLKGEDTYLEATNTLTLAHREHDHLTVPPGQYFLPQQVEYTPQELRNVQD